MPESRLGDIFLKKSRPGPIPSSILPRLDGTLSFCPVSITLSPFVIILVLKSSQKLKAVSLCCLVVFTVSFMLLFLRSFSSFIIIQQIFEGPLCT